MKIIVPNRQRSGAVARLRRTGDAVTPFRSARGSGGCRRNQADTEAND